MSAAVRPPRPRALPVLAENIPADQCAIKRWLGWRYTWSSVKNKWDKPPRTINRVEEDLARGQVALKPGQVADGTSPATWTSFENVLQAYTSGSIHFDGIGFALSPDDDLVGIDLDHCRDPETGVIDEWALQIVRLVNSYTEVSPSGTGLRILLHGTLPPNGRKKGSIETYQDGRYLTFTGHHLEGTPRAIEEREAELLAFHLETFGPQKVAQPRRAPQPSGNLDVSQLLERMVAARQGDRYRALYGGNWSAHYGSQSEAVAGFLEAALFHGGGDRPLAEQLYRESGLYYDKWESPRGAQTWGERTLDFLLGKMQRFREASPHTWPALVTSNGHTDSGTAAGAPAAGECPELAAEVERLAGIVATQRAALAKRDATIAMRDKAIAEMEQRDRDMRDIVANKALVGNAIRVALAAYWWTDSCLQEGNPQPTTVHLPTFAAAAGVSEDTASKELKHLGGGTNPLFVRNSYSTLKERADRETGEITLRPTNVLEIGRAYPTAAEQRRAMATVTLATLPQRPARGGARPPICNEHPDAPTRSTVRRIITCTACNKVLADTPEQVPPLRPQAAVIEEPASFLVDERPLQPQAAVIGDAWRPAAKANPVTDNVRPLLKCRRCRTWLNLDGTCLKECEVLQVGQSPPSPLPPDGDPAWWAGLGVAGGAS